jgi:hypothetical protein
MRRKKHKHVRKALRFYKINHGFKVPFKVLVDGNFVNALIELKYVTGDAGFEPPSTLSAFWCIRPMRFSPSGHTWKNYMRTCSCYLAGEEKCRSSCLNF